MIPVASDICYIAAGPQCIAGRLMRDSYSFAVRQNNKTGPDVFHCGLVCRHLGAGDSRWTPASRVTLCRCCNRCTKTQRTY
jgi:hypothetical protein